jgi:hypothetical protein
MENTYEIALKNSEDCYIAMLDAEASNDKNLLAECIKNLKLANKALKAFDNK